MSGSYVLRRHGRAPPVSRRNAALRLPLPRVYSASFPLTKWTGSRREAIDTLARAHAAMGEVEGPGRPLEIGRPVAHAYVLRVVAEFQGFARDLLDLGTEKIVELSGVRPQFRPLVTTAAADGRRVDRGNANLEGLTNDLKRIGISGLSAKVAAKDRFWGSATGRNDQASFADLFHLRNCLAHGNQYQLDRLRSRGVADTLTWARRQVPGLDRTARALDHIVWEHLSITFGGDPW